MQTSASKYVAYTLYYNLWMTEHRTERKDAFQRYLYEMKINNVKRAKTCHTLYETNTS